MSAIRMTRKGVDPNTGDDVAIPVPENFCRRGQRRLAFSVNGLEYEQPTDDTNSSGSPVDPSPAPAIRIVDSGLNNVVSGTGAVVLGGGNATTPGGSGANIASGNYSAVLAGRDNQATAEGSSVLGGSGLVSDIPNTAAATNIQVNSVLYTGGGVSSREPLLVNSTTTLNASARSQVILTNTVAINLILALPGAWTNPDVINPSKRFAQGAEIRIANFGTANAVIKGDIANIAPVRRTVLFLQSDDGDPDPDPIFGATPTIILVPGQWGRFFGYSFEVSPGNEVYRWALVERGTLS